MRHHTHFMRHIIDWLTAIESKLFASLSALTASFGTDPNKSTFESDGTLVFEGDATVWDDMRVAVYNTDIIGTNPPIDATFKTDGSGSPGTSSALSFLSNSSGTLSIPDSGPYPWDAGSSIEFWFRPKVGSSAYNQIIDKNNIFALSWWGSSEVALNVTGMGFTTSATSLNVGSWNPIIITFEPGSPNIARLYVNGTLSGTITSGGFFSDNTNNIVVNADTILYDIDQLAFWSKVLTPAEVTARYNGGAGSALVGTETDLEACWNMNDGSGSTVTDIVSANNGSISGTENTHFEWISGHVGAPSISSRGVALRYFRPGEINEVFFTLQMPHSWKEGSDIYPHVHWVPESDLGVGEAVEWGLEYTWASIGSTFGDTTIISSDVPEIPNPTTGTHELTRLGTIDGSGETLSSMIVCRVFRDGVSDNYSGNAGLMEIDFHYEIDTIGSRQEFIK
jgi:hypothetical protein